MKKLLYLFLTVLIVACSSEDGANQNSTPVITIIGEANTSVVWGTTYTDAGATAFDSIDGDITEDIITTGEVNTSIEGNYTITYTVSNSSGNSASAIRQVTVEDDGNPVYLADNGVTIKAKEWAIVGDTGVVNGIGYTIVDGETLINMLSNGDDVTRVCTTRIVDMANLLGAVASFNQNINSWDVSNVTNMDRMFASAYAFNQDISNWDVSNVTNMYAMFAYATSYNQNLSSWSVDGVTECDNFSQDATSWTLPQPNFTNCTP